MKMPRKLKKIIKKVRYDNYLVFVFYKKDLYEVYNYYDKFFFYGKSHFTVKGILNRYDGLNKIFIKHLLILGTNETKQKKRKKTTKKT